MKKALTLILALALAFALGVPALAEGEANPGGGSTKLSYTVATKYYVVIPATIELTESNRVLTGNGAFSVTAGSLIDANKTLNFAITGATNYSGGFHLVNGCDNTVKIGYTISTAASEGNAVAKDAFFLTATAAEAFTGKEQSLYLTSAAYTQAGTYTDTLTITVSQEKKPD